VLRGNDWARPANEGTNDEEQEHERACDERGPRAVRDALPRPRPHDGPSAPSTFDTAA